jgi:hypothetical protein
MNNITIELCKEDRDRLDILNKALAMLTGQLEGINAALEAKGIIETVVTEEVISTDPWDTRDLHQEAAEAPQEVVEEQTPPAPETDQDEPALTVAEEDPLQNVIALCGAAVTKQDILQKVIALCGVGKKAKAAAKDIITTYADSVTGLPDSALAEVWGKLCAMEANIEAYKDDEEG